MKNFYYLDDDFEDDPLEIQREDEIEVVESGFGLQKHPLKRTSQRSFERNGAIHKETIVEKHKLSCGHLNCEAGVICSCGMTSFCKRCSNAYKELRCCVCFHFVFKCCGQGIPPHELYCIGCYDALPFYTKIRLFFSH